LAVRGVCETDFVAARCIFLLFFTAYFGFAGTNSFLLDDLAAWRSITDARISPDSQWLTYLEENAGRTIVRLVPLGGKAPVSVEANGWHDRSPRFSFDSRRLAWLSERDAPGREGRVVRIRIRRLDTGEETIIASLPVEPLSIAPAPEGEGVAFTARIPSETPPPAWAPPHLLPRLAPPAGHIQLFVAQNASTAPRRLSAGDFDYPGEPAWMPDGQTIVAAREGGEIYAFRLSGGEKALSNHPGRNECPVPSPDGSKIAWLATDPQPAAYAIRKLLVMNADGARVKILSGSLDRDAAAPQWSSDARTVYFLADDRGATHAYAARSDGTLRQLPAGVQRMSGLSLADNGTLVTVRSTARAAGEVIAFPTDRAGEVRVLAAPNRDLLASRTAGPVEELTYSSDGETIQAWLTRPPGVDPGRKYPLLVDLRDGPPAMCGGEFNLRAQIFAARDFFVLCVNPRGTPGFGEEFGGLLPTRFPDSAADDVLRGVDWALGKAPLDSKRIYVSGGLLTAWLMGHTTRFAAAIARRPMVAWMGGFPWTDPEQYGRHSPIAYAANFRTPTLVIEEGEDPQAAALYSALQARKVESALLRLPAMGGASNRVAELEVELAWLTRAAR
jgi:dipeptidyl aminopeptidase/acylaminoacyl peptidase